MSINLFTLIYQQYKQSAQEFQSALASVALDTITTRFLLLFLFLLSIPLTTVIIFTSSLLASHLDDAATEQLVFSQNLFKAALNEAEENLGSPPTPSQAQTTLPITQETRPFQTNSASPYFTQWRNRLYLAQTDNRHPKDATHPPAKQASLRGIPLNDVFLNHIYQQQPNLHTEIWILREPLNSKQPRWLARSQKEFTQIPEEAFLKALQNKESSTSTAPISLELNKIPYRLLQESIYAADHHKIARVLHILPLARNQMLLNNYYWGIYIISVASLIFSVLLAMLAGRTITQPLLRLIQQVNTLSRENVMKDTDEVAVSGVHEIRQLGESFNRMVKRLRQEHKMKDEFVATLTHDLKVPLLAEKQTLAYFLKQTYGPLTPEQDEVLSIMHSSNRSCLSLVNGLLEVYRYDSGEVSLILEPFNLLTLLEETVGELDSLRREKSLKLTVHKHLDDADNSAGLVYADRMEIKRVLHNLVSNAITNTPLHGSIECHIGFPEACQSTHVYKVSQFQGSTLKRPIKTENRLLVSIQDSGVGFANEDLPYLFKQFAASRGRNPMSIGLGLYNCYQVTQAHNGILWVESTEGEGSVVSFVLPRTQETAQDRRIYHDRRKRSR